MDTSTTSMQNKNKVNKKCVIKYRQEARLAFEQLVRVNKAMRAMKKARRQGRK